MDLYIDPDTNDISLAGGRAVTVSANEEKVQRIRNRLMTVKGEWFTDLDYGLDYENVIWNKQASMGVKAAHIQATILAAADPGDKITAFDMQFDGVTRTLSVQATVQFGNGEQATITI